MSSTSASSEEVVPPSMEPARGRAPVERDMNEGSFRDDKRSRREKEGDTKGLILQQSRRSKGTSGEGQWDSVDPQEAEDKALMEKRVKKANQKERNAKRPTSWDANLDSGRKKKTKADKEEAKGVHDSWLSEANREEKKKAAKEKVKGSALGDLSGQNPFQAVADKTGNKRRFDDDEDGGHAGERERRDKPFKKKKDGYNDKGGGRRGD